MAKSGGEWLSAGTILLGVAVVAMVWANAPWPGGYEALWGVTVPVAGGVPLRALVNDGLMTIFFFTVGLEIRSELHDGALSDVRRSALPLAAALGGMVVPALIYVAVNAGGPSLAGWGIPVATDIAFAVGVLALLGPRVPPQLRVLVLAVAIIDDVGAIVVIALFYSSGISALGLGVAALGVASVLVVRRLGVRSPWAFLPSGLIVWAGIEGAGIHPTLAGVVLGLLTPAVASTAGAEPPTVRIQRSLKGLVDLGIMPLFALANAGITLGSAQLSGEPLRVFIGVGLGLVLGKPIGIFLVALVSTRLGLTRLPTGLGKVHLGLLGLVAGIGFTMSLFIAQLAFDDDAHLETAKLSILVASGLAALTTAIAGRVVLRAPRSAPHEKKSLPPVDPAQGRSSPDQKETRQ